MGGGDERERNRERRRPTHCTSTYIHRQREIKRNCKKQPRCTVKRKIAGGEERGSRSKERKRK
jgi:hypothetical protein